jgi:hypothetical protein
MEPCSTYKPWHDKQLGRTFLQSPPPKKAGNPKWKAEQLLREMILKEYRVLTEMLSVASDESLTFRWRVKERHIKTRQGKWSPTYRKTSQLIARPQVMAGFLDPCQAAERRTCRAVLCEDQRAVSF